MPENSLTDSGVPPFDQWKLIAADFFRGTVGGSGEVIGSPSWQQVFVLDMPGSIAFDASFNRGNDCVVLPGDASDWTVRQQGSFAVFSDGDTFVSIPVGTSGMALGFDDGLRTLVYSTVEQSMKIGEQAFAGVAEQVIAPVDGTKAPPSTMGGSAKLFMAEAGTATVGGRIEVFGTIGSEDITLVTGLIVLDASFNRGNDRVMLDDEIGAFEARLSGSTVRFHAGDLDVTIPVGTAGTQIGFRGGVEHTLVYDAAQEAVLLGHLAIGPDPVALGAIA